MEVRRDETAPVDRWLVEHGDVLWAFVLARVGGVRGASVAEDVVQETLIAAMGAWGTFAGASSERTWLLGIAAHKCADHVRSARRRARHERAFAAEQAGEAGMYGVGTTEDAADRSWSLHFDEKGSWKHVPHAWGLSASSAGERAELMRILRSCMDELPASLLEVVWLRDLLDVPSDEACKAMGITATNLWTRAHRARSALRECVERGLGFDEPGESCGPAAKESKRAKKSSRAGPRRASGGPE